MSILTVWTNPEHAVHLHQLSDDPEDGTAQEQIAYLGTLSFLDGYSCVDQNFTGPVPDGDAAQWRWSDGQIILIPTIPDSITRRQCALQLLAIGMISNAEAVAMVQSGIPPVSVQAYIDALPTEDERARAEIDFAATNYFRDNPLLIAMMEANGGTPESIDEFFIAAATF